jgi:hypothetical protein
LSGNALNVVAAFAEITTNEPLEQFKTMHPVSIDNPHARRVVACAHYYRRERYDDAYVFGGDEELWVARVFALFRIRGRPLALVRYYEAVENSSVGKDLGYRYLYIDAASLEVIPIACIRGPVQLIPDLMSLPTGEFKPSDPSSFTKAASRVTRFFVRDKMTRPNPFTLFVVLPPPLPNLPPPQFLAPTAARLAQEENIEAAAFFPLDEIATDDTRPEPDEQSLRTLAHAATNDGDIGLDMDESLLLERLGEQIEDDDVAGALSREHERRVVERVLHDFFDE